MWLEPACIWGCTQGYPSNPRKKVQDKLYLGEVLSTLLIVTFLSRGSEALASTLANVVLTMLLPLKRRMWPLAGRQGAPLLHAVVYDPVGRFCKPSRVPNDIFLLLWQ